VIKDAAVAKDDEAAARDPAEQLQETTIAGTIDAGRPRNDDVDSRVARGFACDDLSFELRLLLNVAGPERRVFIRRRALDVAVDTDGAAVDDPPGTACLRRFDHRPHGRRVDRSILVAGKARLPVDRGNVIDDLHAVRRALERIGVAQIASDNLDATGVRPQSLGRGVRPRTGQCAHVIAPGRQCTGEVTAGETGGPGH
jgi:hypothetical protein